MYSVAKSSHMLGGALVVRVERVAMSLKYLVIRLISCVLFRGGAAGYWVSYCGMALRSHCSRLGMFASLYSCWVEVGG